MCAVIVLKILLAVLLILAVALAVPVRVYVRYTNEIFLQVRYLFLKINIPITEEQKKSAAAKKQPRSKKKKTEVKKQAAQKSAESTVVESKKTKKKKQKNKKKNPVLEWIKKLYKKGGVDALIAAFGKIADIVGSVLKPIFKNIKIRHLNIDITVAADNAADTAINYGRLCAGVYPALSVILNVMKYGDYKVNIRPDFDKSELETDISAELSLIPWIALAGALASLVKFIGYKIKGEL